MLDPKEGYLEDLLSRLRSTSVKDDSAVGVLPPPEKANGNRGNPAGENALATPAAFTAAAAPFRAEPAAGAAQGFLPPEPQTMADTKLTSDMIENLVLKYMLNRGTCTGREAAAQIHLPFKLLQEVLNSMRADQLIVYKGSGMVSDYQYQMTPAGREQARRLYEHSSYFGAAPVVLDDYLSAIRVQSLKQQQPRVADLQRAFQDLLLRPELISRVAQAVHHGRGLFLYGPPGNGKTSIAQRLTKAFGEYLWIPRAISIDGDILRLFDPCVHEELPLDKPSGTSDESSHDLRWVRIRRPTILAGGELTMDRLEVTLNTTTGVNEAPLQMKSNCGTLVIDDFGRQRISVCDLLNRWIVPLDKGYDFLNLPSGKTIQVPFDQLIVFSTNLEPRDLADEAFLRRIPYKIDINDPTDADFRELIRREAANIGIPYQEASVEHLIQTHYRIPKRPFRSCHPRDLLMQVRTFCQVHQLPLEMSVRHFDVAASNYFAML